MVCQMTKKVDFAEWLKNVLDDKGIKPIDLSRLANIDSGVVTRLLKAERDAKPETLIAIARALRFPPETVFRAAGILPQQTEETELIEQIKHLTKELPPQEQQDILEFIKLRHRLAAQREMNETKRTRNKPAIP